MILVDNTVLSNFALAREINLLRDYSHGKGAVSDYVLAEFEMGIKDGILTNTSLGWLETLTLISLKN